jgi:hypothetical protein
MQPNDHRNEGAQLNELLREWIVADAPTSLEQRVMKQCTPPGRGWWRLLFTGYIRVPVALVYVLAVLMTVTVWRVAAHAPPPCLGNTHSASTIICNHPAPGIC